MRASKRSQLASAEEIVLTELSPWLSTMDYQGAAAHCMEYLAGGTNNAYDDDLKRIFYALWFIENVTSHGILETKVVRPIADMCEVLLQRCGVQPNTSKFGDLYGRVYRSLSTWHQASGNAWQAMWQHSLGQYLTKGMGGPGRADAEPESEKRGFAAAEVMQAANHAYYLGHMASAAAAYFVAESNATERDVQARARLGRIASLRLIGQADSAQDLATAAPFEFADSPDLHHDYQWQELLCEVALHGDALAFVPSWERSSPLYQPRMALISTLLAYAVVEMPSKRRMRRTRTFKEHFQDDVGYATREYLLLKQLMLLELCYDKNTSMVAKLKAAGDLLAEQQAKLQVEERLIILAALMRWLKRVEQPQFLSVLTNEYKSLCQTLSNGVHTNVLGIVADILDDGDLAFSPSLVPFLSELPVSSGPRMLKVSKLAGRAALAMLSKRRGTNNETADIKGGWDQFIIDVVKVIVEDLGKVKGPLMKVAQIFVGIAGVTPEARQMMQKSLAQTTPVEPKLLYEVFKREHGSYPQQIFKNWQHKPIGVGSMAQVFRAELPSGEPVAVKILYPGIASIVASDVNLVKVLRTLLRHVIPETDIPRLADLVIFNIKAECDLRVESRYHQQIYEAFLGDPVIYVPKPYPEYTSTSVHVAEFVVSEHIADYSARVTPEEARHFWMQAFTAYHEVVRRTKLVQIDPHAGNYRVAGDKIVLLDFGSMYPLAGKTHDLIAQVWEACLAGDIPRSYRVLVDHNVFLPEVITQAYYETELAPLIFQVLHADFDITKHEVSKFVPLFFGGLRKGINLEGELAFVYLTFFMFHAMLYAMDPGLPSLAARGERAAG